MCLLIGVCVPVRGSSASGRGAPIGASALASWHRPFDWEWKTQIEPTSNSIDSYNNMSYTQIFAGALQLGTRYLVNDRFTRVLKK